MPKHLNRTAELELEYGAHPFVHGSCHPARVAIVRVGTQPMLFATGGAFVHVATYASVGIETW